MKNKTNTYYLIVNLLIIFLAIISLFFINFIKESKKTEYTNEKISNLTIAYHASIDKYRILTSYILEETIKNDLILSLFERGVNSEDDMRRLYKGLLYKELDPLYKKLKKEGIRQLHFHLKNNESYIRFHKPNKYGDNLSNIRESIRITNKENRNVTVFETGRVVSGFRNVYPLNFNNEHLGSVEISISTKQMIESIMEYEEEREYLFLLKKAVVFPKLFDSQKFLYKTSSINSDFLIEDRDSSLPDSPKKLSNIAIKLNKKISNNKELKEAMTNGDKYGLFIDIDDVFYDITFIPMLGVSKKVEGYLVEYKKSDNLPIIMQLELYIYSLVILGMIGILFLIRIIEQKSKTLDSQKQWFKSITDGLGEGLYVMDLNAKIIYINPIACEILGYKNEEIMGKNAHLLFHSHALNDNSEQKDCPIYQGAIKGGIYTSKKEYFLTSQGENIPVSLTSRLIKKDNQITQIITSFTDISIQKELENKSNILIKALESSVNCVVITDKNANVQWANKAFESLTGFTIDEIIGKNPKEFISSKKQTEEFFSQMWNTILNKKAWKGELVNKKKDGTLYDEELIITPVLDEDNEIINFIAIKQDITNRKLSLLEKEERDKLFYQQSKMAAMGEMLGNIAHQWRQPLSVISTAATGINLQKELDILKDEDLTRSMNTINESAQYLSATIEDFRAFFDPKNNKESEFLISTLINRTLNLVNSQFISKDIEIIKNIEDGEIISLENELIQVLINILNNSRDAVCKIENQRRLIFINIYFENEVLFIEVKDNGMGIKEDIIDRIFEPYFTTKHQSQGTGIGLYMSQDIIKNHLNGTLLVSNENYSFDGVDYIGAKFTIKITKT